MMKVLLLSRYGRRAPNSRLRSYQYIPYLAAQGIRVETAPFSSDRYLKNFYLDRRVDWPDIIASYLRRIRWLLGSRHFDLLWIEHELFPWLPAWAERQLRRMGIPYVVDYDDAVFHRYDRHPHAMVRCAMGQKIDRVMADAALVITGNRYLADRATAAGARRVEILPTVVDLSRYNQTARHLDLRPMTVGWIGTPTNVKYLRVVEGALAELCRDGRIRLVLVGSGTVAFDHIDPVVRSWSEETEVAEIARFDVGIMPLTDDAWTRGKCGYKLIQYMACGLPVVASDVGVNSQIVSHQQTGLLAANHGEWVQALKRLSADPALRRRMGKQGVMRVRQRYDLQVTAPRLAALFSETGSKKKRRDPWQKRH